MSTTHTGGVVIDRTSGARGSAPSLSHPRMSLEEENRFATVLGGGLVPLHRVRYSGGEAVINVGEPERDVGDANVGPEGDFPGRFLLWGEQDEGHPLGERCERVVEKASPFVIMLEDVA